MGTPLFACPGTSLRHSFHPATIARVGKHLVSCVCGSGLGWPGVCLQGSSANTEGTAHSWDRGLWSLQETRTVESLTVDMRCVCSYLCPVQLLPQHLFFQPHPGAKQQGVMASLSAVPCWGCCPCEPPSLTSYSSPAALGSPDCLAPSPPPPPPEV